MGDTLESWAVVEDSLCAELDSATDDTALLPVPAAVEAVELCRELLACDEEGACEVEPGTGVSVGSLELELGAGCSEAEELDSGAEDDEDACVLESEAWEDVVGDTELVAGGGGACVLAPVAEVGGADELELEEGESASVLWLDATG